MKTVDKIDNYLEEGTFVGEYWIPTYGLAGNLREAHLKYFEIIIRNFGKLSKTDDVFNLKKAWVESMKKISDEKTHRIITSKF